MIEMMKKVLFKVTAKKKLWSIAVLSVDKESLFELNSLIPKQPTIEAKDVNDCEASFVADPFLVEEANRVYCFYEIKDKDKGIIGVSSSSDGVNFIYEKIVLEEPFHLSYPSIWKIDDVYYMIPESSANEDIRLYRAISFPYEWKFEKTLLKGKRYVDASLVPYNNMWYMFVSQDTNDTLEIFYAQTFDGEYLSHALNPIYTDNKKYARCGGGILLTQDGCYRFAQDCQTYYGRQLYLLKIQTLTPFEFKEEMVKTILSPQESLRWNGKKMHHAHYLDKKEYYLVAVDGGGYEKK